MRVRLAGAVSVDVPSWDKGELLGSGRVERTERVVVVPTEELEVEVRCGARSGVSRDNRASRRYEDLPIVRRRYLVEHLIMNGGA